MTIHLGVSGVLEDGVGRVLLIERGPGETYPGQFCTPGGGVEYAETLHDALIREFQEEVGLDVVVKPGFLSIQEKLNDITLKHTVLHFYHVRCLQTNRTRLNNECVSVFWLEERVFRDGLHPAVTKMTPSTKSALNEFFSWRRRQDL